MFAFKLGPNECVPQTVGRQRELKMRWQTWGSHLVVVLCCSVSPRLGNKQERHCVLGHK